LWEQINKYKTRWVFADVESKSKNANARVGDAATSHLVPRNAEGTGCKVPRFGGLAVLDLEKRYRERVQNATEEGVEVGLGTLWPTSVSRAVMHVTNGASNHLGFWVLFCGV
jgi:hypothetical protein